MIRSRLLDSAVSALGLKIVGAVFAVTGLALPWMGVGLGGPNDGAIPSSGDVRPAMRVLPTGTFAMGSPATEEGRFDDEKQHQVVLETPFAISVTEVTQAQYERVMGTNPSTFRGQGDRPVENVSRLDAVRYCNRLSDLEGLERCYEVDGEDVKWPKGPACLGYRLPTEAEWEYAARADSMFVYAGGNEPDRVAWYVGNAGGTTHPVGTLAPNAWGLHDMSGNVREWVWDWYADPAGETEGDKNPSGPATGSYRVFRGGSFDVPAGSLRVAFRFRFGPSFRVRNLGLRLSRSFPSSF